MALTLIKVQLNKTKTENNHFCLTGKMARYVAEAVTTHAPLAKHMFFRPELCAGLMHRGCRCCAARPPGEAPPELERDKRVHTGCGYGRSPMLAGNDYEANETRNFADEWQKYSRRVFRYSVTRDKLTLISQT